jgi:GT2 family glycosyltransferase
MAVTANPCCLVSVMITTRNRLTRLPRALESVYAQDYRNLEILILDDASEDGTSDYVRSRHPDIRLFRFEVNRGLIAARNLLMREAKGDYVVSLDDDAYFVDLGTISYVIKQMEAEPKLAVAAFRVVYQRDDAARPVEHEHYTYSFHGCGHCIRKAVLRQTGDYREYALRQGEESDLAIRLLEHGYYIKFFPTAVVIHEVSTQGRDIRLWHTSGPRNLLLKSWINEPFPWFLLSSANSVVRSLIKGIRDGTLPYVLAGFGEAIKESPQVLSMRHPVSSKTMRLHWALRRGDVTDPVEIRKLYESPPPIWGALVGGAHR